MGWITHVPAVKKEGKPSRGTPCAKHGRHCRYRPATRNIDHQIIYADQGTFRTLSEAKEWITLTEGANARKEHVDPKRGRELLQAVYDRVHAERSYAPATVALHAEVWKHLEPLAKRSLKDIRRSDVSEALARIPGPAMKAKARGLLSVMFNDAIAKEEITANPAAAVARGRTRVEKMQERGKRDHANRYLTEAELARLLSELPERYRALVELQARMGLRPGEAVALKVGKFDPMRRTLTIDESASGFTKTGESRELVLPAVVAEMLVEHVAKFVDAKDPDALMFPADHGGMVQSGNFRARIFAPAVERAGIGDGFTPNMLRHSAAAFAIHHGASVYSVQKLLGHAKASLTLDVYGSLWDQAQEQLATTLDEAIRKARVTAKEASVSRIG
jgi:integrase